MKSQEIPDPREIETRVWFVASQWSDYLLLIRVRSFQPASFRDEKLSVLKSQNRVQQRERALP